MLPDNEITKALECCSEVDGWCSSENQNKCPLHGYTEEHCDDYLMKAALDLINRQKAEIERLRDLLHESIEDNNRWVCDCIQMQKDMEKLKSEAYKEFAERLCEGRVLNDPVVIAAKVELEMLTKGDEGK